MRAGTMHEIQGVGGVASLLAATAVGVTTFWLTLVGTCWKAFFQPQVKRLEKALEDSKEERRDERIADQARCDREIAALNARIQQLETILLMHAPQHMRAQMQGALSEIRVKDDQS